MAEKLSPTMLKEKQKILWEEARSIREIILKMLQWGATFLASLQTVIFFFRKDMYEKMVYAGKLTEGQYIPWDRYIIGTFFLFIVAGVFSYLVYITGKRYREVRKQLVDTNIYDIDFGNVNNRARFLMMLVFFIFPIIDVLIRLYIKVELGFE